MHLGIYWLENNIIVSIYCILFSNQEHAIINYVWSNLLA